MRVRAPVMVAVSSLAVLLAACSSGSSSPKLTPTPNIPLASAADGQGNYPGLPLISGGLQTTPSGLEYADLVVGTGTPAAGGKLVTVNFTGWLTDGITFTDGQQRLKFYVGARQAIAGFDEGVRTMRVGGKRRLVIPPELAYGANGLQTAGSVVVLVPPNVTVVMEVELIDVQDAPAAAATPTSQTGA